MSVLLVADGSPRAIESALQDVEFVRLDSISSAKTALAEDPPSVVVVDDDSVGDETAALLDALRTVDDVVPAVLVVSDPDALHSLRSVDRLVVRPFEPATLRTEVEQALLVGEYEEVIGRLFERAKARAGDADGPLTTPGDVQRLRRDADALLDDLVAYDDPGLLAALFSTPAVTAAEE